MKKLIVLSLFCMTLCFVTGCGSKAEDLTKKYIDETNAVSAALERKAPAAEIKALMKKLMETEKVLKPMKVTKSEAERLREKYKPKVQAAETRLLEAMMKNPEGIKAAMKGLDFRPGGGGGVGIAK